MARFLVLLDRSVRRKRQTRYRYEWQSRTSWEEETLRVPPGTTMPRPMQLGQLALLEEYRRDFESCRLFSVHTRNYLRRRAWRYFRGLGKHQPERYVPAVVAALKRYEDADVADGVALLDNWALMHVLFHHSPAVTAKRHGWFPAQGHTLAELAPAPMYEKLWQAAPRTLVDLMKEGRCRPVRQWAIRLVRRDHGPFLSGLPLAELLALLGHEDAEVVALGAEALRGATGLERVSLDQWLHLLETPNPAVLEILCQLMVTHLRPEQVTLEQAVALARRRSLPVARLGFTWLRAKVPATEADCRALLGLAEAEAEPLRPELVRWARGVLSALPHFQATWVLEYLDSRHAEVRAEGWAWFGDEPRARDDVELWRRLLESPYDDVCLRLVADLEDRVARHERMPADHTRLDPDLVRSLWASVLLNIHRGGRTKPVVVGQIVRRLERRPEEAVTLLPVLAVALRSVRGPEWRAGLAGVVQLVERNAALAGPVRQAFPELKLV
jgi:hypothetical protein